ncbi:hypothetical protein M426DRAFT_324587 [Hypoxylon sp. CI-4A]|nr:hypothetical protein M426DRAFT_324587 [Hypoxylon sp. CI-4A]
MKLTPRHCPPWRPYLSPTTTTPRTNGPWHHNPRQHPYRSSSNSNSNPPSPSNRPLIYPEPPTKSDHHHDAASYAAYAARTGLDPTSKTYLGTQYEYTVAQSLAQLSFSLKRVGGRSDLGIDLLGTWSVPSSSSSSSSSSFPLRILVQCKAFSSPSGPQHVRELEGAFVGAPPGWRGTSGVLAFLVAMQPATKGVREALARSRWPMGFVACEREGRVVQMIWNRRAEEEGLEGLGVGVRFLEGGSDARGGDGKVAREDGLVLFWKGVPYVPPKAEMGDA